MANKNIVIDEIALKLYNKARAKILKHNLDIKNLTDNDAFIIILKGFLKKCKT